MVHQEKVDHFEFECNTKETQTTCIGLDFEINKTPKVDIGVQCCIENIVVQPHIASEIEISATESETASENETDSENECFRKIQDEESDSAETPKPLKAAFIVYWTSLLVLFKNCLLRTCLSPATISNLVTKGSQLIVNLKCHEGHKTIWRSQPNCSHYSVGNLTNAASVLFSANTYTRLARFFDLAGIQWITKTSFYAIQKRYLIGIVNRFYLKKSRMILDELKKSDTIHLSGDGRCDSPGHNAKYLTYSMMDRVTSKIVAFSLTQVTEAGNSNRMEKMGFKKGLQFLKKEGIVPDQITTDRHTQIRKYMREEESNISHQFDVWHFVKNIKKRLIAASEKPLAKFWRNGSS